MPALSTLSTSAKNIAAPRLTRRAPTLIRYLLPAAVRSRFELSANAWFIDIREKRSARTIRIARGHAVYLADMMRDFDYFFESTHPIRTRKIGAAPVELVDFSTPRFHQIAGFPDFPILCPSLTEPFATTRQYLDFAQLQPGEVAIDLGSYSCLTSIVLSKAVGPTGRVIAVEPDPLNHEVCATNIEQHRLTHGFSNIELLNVAVSDAEAFLEFSSEGAMGSSAAEVVGTFRGDVIRVPCTTLSEIAGQRSLERVDFVKMDIEGSEQAVIDSSREFFERYRPRIIVEPHVVRGVLSDKVVIAALTEYGYDCSLIHQIGAEVPLIGATPRH